MNMILFSSTKLEKALADNKITNWQKAKYIIIPAVVFAPIASIVNFVSPRFNERPPGIHFLIELLFTIITMVITYFGIRYCFKINEIIDRQDFIMRFSILLLPVTFKVIFIFLPLSLIVTGIIDYIAKQHLNLLNKFFLIFLALMPIVTLIYFSLLVRSFRRLDALLTKKNS
jgi:hypothetical protein